MSLRQTFLALLFAATCLAQGWAQEPPKGEASSPPAETPDRDAETNRRVLQLLAETRGARGYDGMQQAAAKLREALALQPENAHVLGLLGDALVELGETDEAEENYRKSLEVDPTLARTWFMRGRLHTLTLKPAKAEEYYLKAMELDPNMSQIPQALGSLCLHSNQPVKAIAYSEKALALDPENHVAQGSLASALAQSGRHDEAKRICEEMLANPASELAGLVQLVQLYETSGDDAERDRHRALLFERFKSGENRKLTADNPYVRELFFVGKSGVAAREYFELRGSHPGPKPWPIIYKFEIYDYLSGQYYDVSLGSYTEAADGKRNYHLDRYFGPNGHNRLMDWPDRAEPPTYEEVRQLVVDSIVTADLALFALAAK